VPVEAVPLEPPPASVDWVRLRRTRQFGDDDGPGSTAERTYLVKCATKDDGPEAAVAACPEPGDSFSDDRPGLVVTERVAEELDRSGTLFEVRVSYATRSTDDDEEEADQDKDPTERATVVRLSFDSFEETVYQAKAPPTAEDADGNSVSILTSWQFANAVCNSVGKPFDPSITDTFRDPVITITQNYDAIPWETVVEYINTVNSDTFSIIYRGNTYTMQPGQAWLYDVTTESRYENGVAYEEVTWVIKVRKDGWLRKVLDQSLEQASGVESDPDVRKPKPILDSNGDPIQQPAMLNGKGWPLTGSQKPVFLKFRLKETKAFANLPI
jgi:hypothetical protein